MEAPEAHPRFPHRVPEHLTREAAPAEKPPKLSVFHRMFLKSTIKHVERKIEFNEELVHHLTDPEIREALARGEIHDRLRACPSFREIYSPVYSAIGAFWGIMLGTVPQALRQAHAARLIQEYLPNMDPSQAGEVHRVLLDNVGRGVPPRELALGVLLGAALPFYWGTAKYFSGPFKREERIKRALRGYRLRARSEQDMEQNLHTLDKLVFALKRQNTAHERYLTQLQEYARNRAVDKSLRAIEKERARQWKETG